MRVRHPLYATWSNMLNRCNNPKSTSYPFYGARGIRVCRRWHNFDNFVTDMSPTYVKGLTLDRVNNLYGYKPSNCRWATKKEQQNNMRSNVRFLYRGMRLTIPQISELSGVSKNTIFTRIYRDGRTVEEAISTNRLRTRRYSEDRKIQPA